MSTISWTEEAVAWLQDIHDYIARDNPVAADRVLDGVFEKVELLHSFPQMGHVHETVEEGVVRILLYGHYRIAYLIKRNQQIDILGVFHGAMQMDRYLPKSDEGKS